MKWFTALNVLAGIMFFASSVNGGESTAEGSIDMKIIETDVKHAAERAKVQLEPGLAAALSRRTISGEGDTLKARYGAVSQNDRVERLKRYFDAKAKSDERSKLIRQDDVTDFHWGYVLQDTNLSTLRVKSLTNARLLSVETASQKYSFPRAFVEPDRNILIPTVGGWAEPHITATFAIADQKVLWTGTPQQEEMVLKVSDTTRGCEISINSNPPGALIFFNDGKWHKRTNERVIHNPGDWEAVIRLDGYKDWRQKKRLEAGTAWIINAQLEKQ